MYDSISTGKKPSKPAFHHGREAFGKGAGLVDWYVQHHICRGYIGKQVMLAQACRLGLYICYERVGAIESQQNRYELSGASFSIR